MNLGFDNKIRNTCEREVLGIKNVGVNDNFFTLGGHSLLATQVVSRLNKRFSVQIPLSSFFETPTVAALSCLVDTSRWMAQYSRIDDRLSREEGNI